MLKIRLQKVGRKHDYGHRVVLMDSARAARSGSVKEVLGFYNTKTKDIKLEGEKIKSWAVKGAQISDTVHNLLVKNKIIKGPKINVLPSKKKSKEEAKTAEAKSQAPAPAQSASNAPSAAVEAK